MRSQVAHVSGQRPLDSRAAQQPACSCSYPIQPCRPVRRERRGGHVIVREQVLGRRPSSACGAVAATVLELAGGVRSCRLRGDSLRCFAAAEPGPGPDSVISGYTPANYISFSEDEKDVAAHAFVIEVDAPANICFGIWNDWNRLVEFLDLVAQIGLDANNSDLALIQCFYRHGLLPVMEIVFVLQKTEVVPDKRISFESVWGMPMAGSVTFKSLRSGKTRVLLSFKQSLPDLLVDLKVGVFGVQNSLMPILSENMHVFRQIAEAEARDPSSRPPREEGGERAYMLFDEEADMALFEEIMERYEYEEDEEEDEQAAGQGREEDEQQPQEDDERQDPEERGGAGATGPSLLGSTARGPGREAGEDAPGSSSPSSSPSSSASRQGVPAAGDSRRAGGVAVAGRAAGSDSGDADSAPSGAGAAADVRRRSTAARGAGRATSEAPQQGSRTGTGGTKRRAAR